MAKSTRKITTLSPELARKMPRVASIVLGDGGGNDGQGYEGSGTGSPREVWLKIVSATLISTGVWRYTCELWTSPWATGKIPGSSVYARNTWELNASFTMQAGYTLDVNVTGVSPVQVGSYHRSLGRYKTGSERGHIFTARNDPIVTCPS